MPKPVTRTEVAFGLDHVSVAVPPTFIVLGETLMAAVTPLPGFTVTDTVRVIGPPLPWAVRVVEYATPTVPPGTARLRVTLSAAHTHEEVAQLAGDEDTTQQIVEKVDRIEQLKAEGYAPLMRFGSYYVDVFDSHGDRQYFGMYETEREAVRRLVAEGALTLSSSGRISSLA